MVLLLDTGTPNTSREIFSEDADGETLAIEHFEPFESHHRHPHCKFLYWYREFLCPVEPLYFSDERSITVEK